MPTEPGGSSAARAATVPCARPQPVGLLRRLAAAAYDGLLLFAVLFFATAFVLPFFGGRAIAPGNGTYLLYLLAVSFLYFGWFWTHGGQTLGMKAWHIRLRSSGGGAVSWKWAGLRFLAAILSWSACGAGFLWASVDAERRAWHDRLSQTQLGTAREHTQFN